MQGKRVADFTEGHLLKPGEYCKYPEAREDTWWPGKPYFILCTPNGMLGSLVNHQVTEYQDGTITASPSILTTTEDKSWHGYLENGIWREC